MERITQALNSSCVAAITAGARRESSPTTSLLQPRSYRRPDGPINPN